MKLLTTATILLPLLTLTIGTPLTNTAVNLTSNPLEPADGSWIHLCKSHKCSDIHTPCMTACCATPYYNRECHAPNTFRQCFEYCCYYMRGRDQECGKCSWGCPK